MICILSTISVKIDGIKGLNVNAGQNAKRLSDIKDGLSSLRYNIDSEIGARRNIDGRMYDAYVKASAIESKLYRLEAFINNSMNKYNAAEDYLVREAVSIGRLQEIFIGDSSGEIIPGSDSPDDITSIEDITISDVLSSNMIPFLNVVKYIISGAEITKDVLLANGMRKAGFEIIKNGKYLIVKGKNAFVRGSEIGIPGRRYAIDNLKNYPEIGKYMNPITGAKEGFKGALNKFAIAGIALETTVNWMENDKNNEDLTKKLADATVDVGLGVGVSLATGAITGAAVGSVVPVVGTAVGAVIGVGVSVLSGIAINAAIKGDYFNGKSIEKHLKDNVEKGYRWFSKKVGNAVQGIGEARSLYVTQT